MQDLPPLSLVDILAMAIILLGIFRGVRIGLSGEIARLVALLAGLALGLYAYEPIAAWTVAQTGLTGLTAAIPAFALTAALAVLAMALLRAVLAGVIRFVVRDDFDRAGGGVAGFITSALFVLLVFLAMQMLPGNTRLYHAFADRSVIGTMIAPRVPDVDLERQTDEAEPDG